MRTRSPLNREFWRKGAPNGTFLCYLGTDGFIWGPIFTPLEQKHTQPILIGPAEHRRHKVAFLKHKVTANNTSYIFTRYILVHSGHNGQTVAPKLSTANPSEQPFSTYSEQPFGITQLMHPMNKMYKCCSLLTVPMPHWRRRRKRKKREIRNALNILCPQTVQNSPQQECWASPQSYWQY